MKKWRTSLEQHKYLFLFLSILFIFGILSGILFYYKQDLGVQKNILINAQNMFGHNIFTIKNIGIHLGCILLLIAASFLFLAPLIFIFLFFFEGVSLGFVIPIFFSLYKWKAILVFGLYFILVKGIYLILIYYFFVNLILFCQKFKEYFKYKKLNFLTILKKLFILGLFIILNDVLIYFFANKLFIFLFN